MPASVAKWPSQGLGLVCMAGVWSAKAVLQPYKAAPMLPHSKKGHPIAANVQGKDAAKCTGGLPRPRTSAEITPSQPP